MRLRSSLAVLLSSGLVVGALAAQTAEKLDYRVLAEIRDEGLNRSQVMEMVGWLADVHGPRMTGSPGYRQAADWAAKKMTDSASRTCTSSDGRSARDGSCRGSTPR